MMKLTVAGGGTLGSQIGYQAAVCGVDVTFWMHTASSIMRIAPRIAKLEAIYNTFKPGQMPPALSSLSDPSAAIASAKERIHYETDLPKAMVGCDLLIECVPEVLEAKQEFFKKAAPYMTESMLAATNTSSLLPSQIAEYVPYSQNFLAMHFANMIWQENLCEIMPDAKTFQASVDKAVQYAREMGMVPAVMKKEHAGYLLNSLLIPFLNAAQALLAQGIADLKEIDLAWKKGTGAPYGPFEMLNIIGLPTALHIVQEDPQSKEPGTIAWKTAQLLTSMIAKNQRF